MDLREQANAALDALLVQSRAENLGADWANIARMMWLDGYKHGMDTVHGIAQASFDRLQAELS